VFGTNRPTEPKSRQRVLTDGELAEILSACRDDDHGRKAERPINHLAGFKGILQVDGYAGYRALAERSDVQLAFCWAHVRRRFYELAATGPAPIASEALKRIAELYAVETEIRGRSADERCARRQEKSRPILDALEPWLRTKLGLISQKTKLAEAIRYALTRGKD
jgi:transposase